MRVANFASLFSLPFTQELRKRVSRMDSYAYDYGGYAAADASATATTVGVGAAAAACCFQIVFVALVVGCCLLMHRESSRRPGPTRRPSCQRELC